jgi:CheY-like chemotaxis protein
MSGYVVEPAEDGAAAVAAAQAFLPDVVLMDLAMPGMDGYETARRIRRLSGLSRTSFVALTGYGQPADLRRSREEGFAAHVVKPADFHEIRAALTTAATTLV